MASPVTVIIIPLVLVFLSGTAYSVIWKACPGTTKGTIKNVNVVGCETTDTCELHKGKNASIEIDFTPAEDSASAKSVVYGVIFGLKHKFDLANPDVCKDSGVVCPLKSGSAYTYTTNIYVSPSYPSLSLTVEWEIQDAASADLVCFTIPVKLVSASSDNSAHHALPDSRLTFRSNKL